MRRRLARAILLLYPSRVRQGHGPEILALIDDLVTREGRSPATLLARLAFDGLAQRAVSTATAWTVMAVLVTISFGGLALSDFSSASALSHRPGFTAPGRTRRTSHPTGGRRQMRDRSPRWRGSQTRTADHRRVRSSARLALRVSTRDGTHPYVRPGGQNVVPLRAG